jgi:hypothetical protein
MDEIKTLGQKEYKRINIIAGGNYDDELTYLFKVNEDGSILRYNGLVDCPLIGIEDDYFYKCFLRILETYFQHGLYDILKDNIKNKTPHKRYEINAWYRISEVDIIKE